MLPMTEPGSAVYCSSILHAVEASSSRFRNLTSRAASGAAPLSRMDAVPGHSTSPI